MEFIVKLFFAYSIKRFFKRITEPIFFDFYCLLLFPPFCILCQADAPACLSGAFRRQYLKYICRIDKLIKYSRKQRKRSKNRSGIQYDESPVMGGRRRKSAGI